MTTISGKGRLSIGWSSKIGDTSAGLEAGAHAALQLLAGGARVGDPAVEGEDVAHAQVRHEPVALVHLPHDPLEGDDGLVRLGDDRGQEVRDVLVNRELDHLGVDHDHPELVRPQPVEEREDHGVDGDRLARAGGAGDEQMRHAGEIDDDGGAADVLAQGQRQAGAAAGEDGGFQELAQIDGGTAVVRQLDADHVAAGDDGDADGEGTQAARDVVGEADHAGSAGAWGGLQLVEGDDRAGLGVRDLAADAEIVEHRLQLARDLVQHLLGERGLRHVADGGQEVEARQLVGTVVEIVGGYQVELLPAALAAATPGAGLLPRPGRAAGGVPRAAVAAPARRQAWRDWGRGDACARAAGWVAGVGSSGSGSRSGSFVPKPRRRLKRPAPGSPPSRSLKVGAGASPSWLRLAR